MLKSVLRLGETDRGKWLHSKKDSFPSKSSNLHFWAAFLSYLHICRKLDDVNLQKVPWNIWKSIRHGGKPSLILLG